MRWVLGLCLAFLLGANLWPRQAARRVDPWSPPPTNVESLELALKVTDDTSEVERRLSQLKDHDLFLYGSAWWNHSSGAALLAQVQNQAMPHLHDLWGVCLNSPASIPHWQREVENGGDAASAVQHWFDYLRAQHDVAGVRALAQDPRYGPYLTTLDRIWLLHQEHDWLPYVGLHLRFRVERQIRAPLLALLEAYIIAAIWLLFLRRVDPARTQPWWALLVAFGLGELFNGLCEPLETLIDSVDPRHPSTYDLIFTVFHIGVAEEMCKLLPVLLVLRRCRRPIDYLMYASVSALGFATVENLYYFSQPGVQVPLDRCFNVAHLAWTSMVFYPLARARFFKPTRVWLGLVAAVAAHGFYDRLNDLPALLFALATAWVYARMLANALSFSGTAEETEVVRNDRMLIAGACLLLAVPFAFYNFGKSTQEADAWLLNCAWNMPITWLYIRTYVPLSYTDHPKRAV